MKNILIILSIYDISIVYIILSILLSIKDIINDLNKCETWKTQLTTAINCMSSKDSDEERVMHSKKYSIEIMINDLININEK